MPAPDPATSLRCRYRRLPGRMPVLRLVSNAASVLWLGEDHLLQVETMYFNECYRRFSYGDIQSVLLRETSRGLVYDFILAALAALFGLAGISMDDPSGRGFFYGGGAFWVLLLIVNLIRGKTCRCSLQTAAGPHPLPSLNRLRPAHKALRLLTEKVEAVQGALTPGDAARQMDNRARSAPAQSPRGQEFDY